MAISDFFKLGKSKTAAPQRRAFAAARIDRLTAGWMATTNSINHELRSDLDKLRARSRQLAKDNDYARRFVGMVANNVGGPNGFTLQARVENSPGVPDVIANDSLERAFYEWAQRGVCEITGKMGFSDLIRAILRGTATDGEYLVRKVRGAAAGNRFGYALQLIDMDRLDTLHNRAPTEGVNAIIMGVEVNAFRRPVAYYILTAHPSDHAQERRRERIPAEEILHDFITERAEQVRGIPWMTGSMLSLHHLGEFEQSALLAARKGADTLGFFVSPDGEPPIGSDADADTGEPITVSVPGSYDTLPEGYDFRPYDSRYPDAMMADFTKGFLRKIASGFGVSAHNLTGDMNDVNYSSARIAELAERDGWLVLQDWFIQSFLKPVFMDWLETSLLASAIVTQNGTPLPASRLEKFRAHHWQGRRWQWVDPVKDIEAARLAIKSGIASPQMIAAQNGVDVEDVIGAIARFEQQAAAAGVTLIDYEITRQQPADSNQVDAMRALGDQVRALSERQQPAPVIHVGAPSVTLNQAEVRINVEPPAVNVAQPEIRNEIIVEPTPIQIAAPEIRNIIEVEPTPIVAEVNVEMPAPEVSVQLPARKTETTIVRDQNGEISSTTQIETSIEED